MIEEVRRQFREIPGIMEGKSKPDYTKCVDISTKAALREMIIPGVMAVVAPIIIGFLLGTEAVGGMLAGSLVTGVMMAIFMSNAGGAWDNAKKYIERRQSRRQGLLKLIKLQLLVIQSVTHSRIHQDHQSIS